MKRLIQGSIGLFFFFVTLQFNFAVSSNENIKVKFESYSLDDQSVARNTNWPIIFLKITPS